MEVVVAAVADVGAKGDIPMKTTNYSHAQVTKGFNAMNNSRNQTRKFRLLGNQVSGLVLISLVTFAGTGKLEAARGSAVAKMRKAAAAPEQKQFATPEEAAKALADAAKEKDLDAIVTLFGPEGEDLARSGDDVQDRARLELLSARVSELTAVNKKSETSAEVLIGKERWPLPIPLAKKGDKWEFDSAAGRDEILNRRIGQNELDAIKVCRAVVLAQKDYFEMSLGADGHKEYAAKFVSDEGKKNGLYWPTAGEEKPSPLGPLMAEAQAEGYTRPAGTQGPKPYHGYMYRVLAKQGASAEGGAKSFVKDGHMTEGFAIIAYPAEYGDSGIMTFVVGSNGLVLQRDLGKKTGAVAGRIMEFNPDRTWRQAQ